MYIHVDLKPTWLMFVCVHKLRSSVYHSYSVQCTCNTTCMYMYIMYMYVFVMLQDKDIRIILAYMYEDKARYTVCQVHILPHSVHVLASIYIYMCMYMYMY